MHMFVVVLKAWVCDTYEQLYQNNVSGTFYRETVLDFQWCQLLVMRIGYLLCLNGSSYILHSVHRVYVKVVQIDCYKMTITGTLCVMCGVSNNGSI